MELGAVCDVDYDDCPSVFHETWPTARRPHKCCECRGMIQSGKRYQRVWGVWHGDQATFKTCATCARIRRDYGCSFGALVFDIWERLGVNYLTGAVCEDDIQPTLDPAEPEGK